MPINRKDFELGLDETISKFVEIFVDNPNKAFTIEDVAEQTKVDRLNALWVLSHLQKKGLIKGKFIRSEWYYILAP